MSKIELNIIVFLILLSISGCLKDNPVEYPKVTIGNTTEILFYLEAAGDYINSSEMPSLVECDEVYNNLNGYLIVDVRNKEKFLSGHIKGAYNIANDSLWIFLKNIGSHNYPKVIIVSETGQSSSYYTCLLKLGGFSNIFSMNFGMAYWHSDFSEKWIKSLGNYITQAPFNNSDYEKHPFTNLPEITFRNNVENIGAKLESRIQSLLAAGFPEDSAEANMQYTSDTFITLQELANYFEVKKEIYLICYGTVDLYKGGKMNDPFPEQGHFPNTVNYLPKNDLKSVNNLQTLPVDKMIGIYDYNGQTSASITAYLRLLGYNAKSVLFGANSMFYQRLVSRESEFAFYTNLIRNYEYEK